MPCQGEIAIVEGAVIARAICPVHHRIISTSHCGMNFNSAARNATILVRDIPTGWVLTAPLRPSERVAVACKLLLAILEGHRRVDAVGDLLRGAGHARSDDGRRERASRCRDTIFGVGRITTFWPHFNLQESLRTRNPNQRQRGPGLDAATR
eukprot:CAMPEP_0115548194 /NCGR_PEP_ID=MMETSP0271-20121206/94039_1 /TAXON_ID=71861 /ORGANISM="Scrippsiella trochoidea, Strain CCMP3099" /LENGTH=151 /DNA_ID=CAMNT_0002981655 /DNA_START=229 /DNA_END=684 /DNA_ORIENTATION=+